jgi:hypothetical protein
MELFVVINMVGGLSLEDESKTEVAGVFTTEELANNVKKVAGYDAKVVSIKLDEVKTCYIEKAKDIFNIDINNLLYRQKYGVRKLKDDEFECLISAEEFEECDRDNSINSDDGDGYWASEEEISNISCWSNKPDWATHVCFFAK